MSNSNLASVFEFLFDPQARNLIRFQKLEIEFLKRRLKGRLLPDEAEKAVMARLAVEIGRPDLKDCALLFHPETLFRWHKELVRAKFDGSCHRKPGRPSAWRTLWGTVERFAKDNPTWGSARIQGQLKSLGFGVSEPSVRRIMRQLGFNPKPGPSKRWSDFLERHKASIVATDFFTYEAWTPQGLKSLYVLFFIQHDTRKVHIAGITEHPDEAWMAQQARNLTMEGEGFFKGRKFLIQDRDAKYCVAFRDILRGKGIRSLRLPWHSPNLNAYAERWVRTVKQECLSHLLLPGPASLKNALDEYLNHYHHERAHQGLGNEIPFPKLAVPPISGDPNRIQRKSRLGGLLNSDEWPEDFQTLSAA